MPQPQPAYLAGPLLITLGSLFTLGILSYMVCREPKIYIKTMAIGALCWLVGNVLWVFGTPVFQIVWWWAAFLVLTVAGERLELSRVLHFKRQHYQLFALVTAIFLIGWHSTPGYQKLRRVSPEPGCWPYPPG